MELFQIETGVNIRSEPVALQRLKDALESARCELSTRQEAEIQLPFLARDSTGSPLHYNRVLTRKDVEWLTGSLVHRTIEICRESLNKANLSPDDVDEVLLVGGVTRMPMLQREVAAFFGKPASRGVHPDEAVALGAAILGATLAGEKPDLTLEDVTSHGLGIMIEGGVFTR